MEKKNSILIVEAKDGKLFQSFQEIKSDLELEKADFLEAKELLRHIAPHLVIFNFDHQKNETKEILESFCRALPKTHWVISAKEMAMEELIDFMRLGVADFLKQPFDQGDLGNLIRRIENLDSKRPQDRLQEPHRIISFFSNKGGVGVSMVAANVAVEMVKKKLGRILINDFVLQHGNIAEFLDITPQYTLIDLVENRERLDAKLLENSLQKHASGIFVLPCPK